MKQKNSRKQKTLIAIIAFIAILSFVLCYCINLTNGNVFLQRFNAGVQETSAGTSYSRLVDSVEVGDYVAYDATNNYSYTSPAGGAVPIPGESESENVMLTSGNGYGEQTFTSNSNIKWKVFSKDTTTGEIVLISENGIKTDSDESYKLKGTFGYLFAEEELNKICGIYGHGLGADTSKKFTYEIGGPGEEETKTTDGTGARSINIDDINKQAGITESDYKSLESTYGNTTTYDFRYPTRNKANGISTDYKTLTYNFYTYDERKISNETIRSLLFENNNYFLSSRYRGSANVGGNNVAYGVGFVGFNEGLNWVNKVYRNVNYVCCDRYSSTFNSDSLESYQVRPVVYLQSDLVTTGKDADGAWQIGIEPKSISLNTNSMTFDISSNQNPTSAQRKVLKSIIDPSDANVNQHITGTSSDDEIAFFGLMDSYGGFVTPRGKTGIATITLTTGNGLTATCEVNVVKLNLTQTSGTGYAGGKSLTTTIDGGNYGTATATSSAPNIATASVSGNTVTINPISAGTATITVKGSNGNPSATYTITVIGTSISLSETSGTCYVGGSNLTATISGENMGSLSIENSDATKATASISGNTLTIEPKAAGTATITVKESNGNKEVKYNVTVKATSIGLNETSGTCYVGGSNLTATIAGENIGNLSIENSDATKATASISGNILTIEPKAAGTATITVKEANGNKEVKYNVTVKATSIGLSETSGTCYVGGSNLTTTISGENMGSLSLENSDDTKVAASINGNTLTIEPKAAGTATITVKEANGNKEVKYNVTVKATSISLSEESGYVRMGNEREITISGENMGTLSLENSDDTVVRASINNNKLKLEAVSVGNAVIKVKEANGNKETSYNVTISDLSINPTIGTLDISGVNTVNITANNQNAGIVRWTSDNPQIATVSPETGNEVTVTGVSNGTATITATGDNDLPTATCKITVETSPTSISIDKTSLILDTTEIDEADLVATINPETSNVKNTLTWETSDESIATISKTDENSVKVIGIKNGTAQIKVTTENGKTATCDVVVQTSPKQLSISGNRYLAKGQSDTYFVTYAPEETSTELIEWKLTDETVAEIVESDGERVVLKGLKEGQTRLTARSANNVSNTMTITVTSLKMKNEDVTIDLSESNTTTLEVENSNVGEIKWSSSNEEVVKLNQYDGDSVEITGMKNGTAMITAIGKNGNAEARCMVTVETSPTEVTLNEIVATLDMSAKTNSSENNKLIDEIDLIASIGPETANVKNTLTWKTNNEDVVSLSSTEGKEVKVTAISNGTATVTVETENGKVATCEITVQTSPTEITLDKENITLDLSGKELSDGTSAEEDKLDEPVGLYKQAKLNAQILPETANVMTDLTWESSNPEIVTVDENGVIAGKSNGTAVITVKTENEITATCEVIVQTSPTEVTLNKNNIVLNAGEEIGEELIATILPRTANVGTNLKWSTDNNEIVDLSTTTGTNINVKGIKAGTATIKVETENEKTASCNVKVENLVTKISMKTMPKTVYEVNDELDLTIDGQTFATIEITRNNGTKEEIALNDSRVKIVGFDNSKENKELVLTVIYTEDENEYKTSYNVSVIDTLLKIEIENMPKTEYLYGEEIDVSEGKLKLTKLTGETLIDIREDMLTEEDGTKFITTKLGTRNIVLTYGDKTLLLEVTVADYLADIKLEVPTKTVYEWGENLDLTGGTIEPIMASGTKKELISLSDNSVKVEGFNNKKEGKQILTVAYQDKVKEYEVRVEDNIQKIEVSTTPKTEYLYGEELDVTKGKITTTRTSGKKEVIEITKDMVSGYNSNKLGNQELTVKYQKFETKYSINVSDYTVDKKITVPTKLEYKYGEKLDLTGATIEVTKESGAKEIIKVTEDMLVTKYNANKLGEQKLTITYEGVNKEFIVKVTDEVKSIKMKTKPTKVEYKYGENLDLAGATISIERLSGTEDIKITKDMISGYNAKTPGKQRLTVTYGGLTTRFTVRVAEKESNNTNNNNSNNSNNNSANNNSNNNSNNNNNNNSNNSQNNNANNTNNNNSNSSNNNNSNSNNNSNNNNNNSNISNNSNNSSNTNSNTSASNNGSTTNNQTSSSTASNNTGNASSNNKNNKINKEAFFAKRRLIDAQRLAQIEAKKQAKEAARQEANQQEGLNNEDSQDDQNTSDLTKDNIENISNDTSNSINDNEDNTLNNETSNTVLTNDENGISSIDNENETHNKNGIFGDMDIRFILIIGFFIVTLILILVLLIINKFQKDEE